MVTTTGAAVLVFVVILRPGSDPFAALRDHVQAEKVFYFREPSDGKYRSRVLLVKGLSVDQTAKLAAHGIASAGYKKDEDDSSDENYEYYAKVSSTPDTEAAIFISKDPAFPEATVVVEAHPARWQEIFGARFSTVAIDPFSNPPKDVKDLFDK